MKMEAFENGCQRGISHTVLKTQLFCRHVFFYLFVSFFLWTREKADPVFDRGVWTVGENA